MKHPIVKFVIIGKTISFLKFLIDNSKSKNHLESNNQNHINNSILLKTNFNVIYDYISYKSYILNGIK